MHFSVNRTISIFLLCLQTVEADITLGSFPSAVDIGVTYTLNWTAGGAYTYDIWLVLKESDNIYNWNKTSTLAQGLNLATTECSFNWTVPPLNTSNSYGIWVRGFPTFSNGSIYTAITDYFAVNSETETPSSSTTVPSSTTTATSTNTATGADKGSDNKASSKLSSGAIAGIVIGVVVAIAVVVALVIFGVWRHRRNEIERREAAKRQSRLEPVMKGAAPEYGYELQRRSTG